MRATTDACSRNSRTNQESASVPHTSRTASYQDHGQNSSHSFLVNPIKMIEAPNRGTPKKHIRKISTGYMASELNKGETKSNPSLPIKTLPQIIAGIIPKTIAPSHICRRFQHLEQRPGSPIPLLQRRQFPKPLIAAFSPALQSKGSILIPDHPRKSPNQHIQIHSSERKYLPSN